jgi:hypothetical protein
MFFKRIGFAPCALLAMFVSMPSHAGFFIPKDTTMVMTMLSPDEQNYEIAYGFDRRLSGSVGLTRVRESGSARVREGGSEAAWRNVVTTQATYLVHRFGTERGIFNAYVWGGPIAETLEGANRTRVGGQAGVWLDYETRRIYTRVKAHAFKSKDWRRNEVVAQGMVAPYEADYEDVAAWGGLQLKRVSGEKSEVTPYVRFFRKQWWIDAGVSVDRTHRNNFFFNFMYTF